ncbi:MAG: hypothetical protein JOZ19_15235 [Rubrobacter sp.]|nr:hypothetical protein [Rubrobacter sp.]
MHLYETQGKYPEAQEDLSFARTEYYQKRIDQLQRRYISAIKALGQVRRLLRVPSQSVQVNIAEQQVNGSERLTP